MLWLVIRGRGVGVDGTGLQCGAGSKGVAKQDLG